MKKNEIALLIIIVSVTLIATYAIGNALFGQVTLQPVDIRTAEAINPEITNEPDPAVFNSDAINPAVSATIGDQSNQQPFTISD